VLGVFSISANNYAQKFINPLYLALIKLIDPVRKEMKEKLT